MMDIIGKILVEVLSILAIATKEIRQGRTSEYFTYITSPPIKRSPEKYMKKLIGRTDIKDALKRLDKLTQEEARMATAQVLKATHSVDDRVREVADNVDQVKRLSYSNLIRSGCGASYVLSGNQLWDSLHKWLSPPDPSTNHNIACGTHQKITANWFFQGGMFTGWKSTSSLLWIHGKRACHVAGRLLSCLIPSDNVLCSQPALARAFSGPSIFGDFSIEILNPSLSSTIIQDIEAMYKAGQASDRIFLFRFSRYQQAKLEPPGSFPPLPTLC
jgi:hypothetical protein